MRIFLTLQLHADVEALLEAAVRAALTLCLVYLTALVLDTRVALVVLHSALEEALPSRMNEDVKSLTPLNLLMAIRPKTNDTHTHTLIFIYRAIRGVGRRGERGVNAVKATQVETLKHEREQGADK